MRGPANNTGDLEPFAHAEAEAQLAAHVGVNRIVERPMFDRDGRVVLVRQYRYPVGEATWEIPAGKLDAPGDDRRRRALAERALRPLVAPPHRKLLNIPSDNIHSNTTTRYICHLFCC